jgi:flagellar hook protein FlgE
MAGTLYTATAALLSHQQRMDVIADDLANVNTTGFKSQRMSFVDAFNQTWVPPTNSKPAGVQIGTGNLISVVNQDFSQGAFQRTGLPTDLALSGEGFFVFNSGANGDGDTYFSRDGALTIDKNGWLINALGYYLRGVSASWSSGSPPVMGTQAVDPGSAAPSTIGDLRIPNSFVSGGTTEVTRNCSIDVNGRIMLYSDTGNGYVSGYITLAKFNNPQTLEKRGSNQYVFTGAGKTFSGGSSFSEAVDTRRAGTNGCAFTQTGALELSNVDLAETFSDMIVTQRAFDANAKLITTADELLQIATGLRR